MRIPPSSIAACVGILLGAGCVPETVEATRSGVSSPGSDAYGVAGECTPGATKPCTCADGGREGVMTCRANPASPAQFAFGECSSCAGPTADAGPVAVPSGAAGGRTAPARPRDDSGSGGNGEAGAAGATRDEPMGTAAGTGGSGGESEAAGAGAAGGRAMMASAAGTTGGMSSAAGSGGAGAAGAAGATTAGAGRGAAGATAGTTASSSDAGRGGRTTRDATSRSVRDCNCLRLCFGLGNVPCCRDDGECGCREIGSDVCR